jgi:hypothetical protein
MFVEFIQNAMHAEFIMPVMLLTGAKTGYR